MLVDGREVFVRELGYKELLDEAARHRFERDVLGVQTDLPKPCCVTLVWIGRRMVTWGKRMEVKYGSLHIVGPATSRTSLDEP